MAETDNIYRLILRGKLLTEDVTHIFHFKRTNALGIATDLGQQFIDIVLPEMIKVISNDLTFENLTVQALFSNTDFDTRTFNVPGLRAGGSASSFMTMAFTLVPLILSQRAGGKRLAGLNEADLEGNVVTPTQFVRLQALAPFFKKVLIGAVANYQPYLESNRKILGIDVVTYQRVADCVYTRVSTQRSRMPGSGT